MGKARLVAADGRVMPLERRDAALLALLALEGAQSRAVLARLLWPDVEPAKALTNLRQRLYRLRRDTGHPMVADQGLLHLADGVLHDAHPESWAAAPADFDLLAGLQYSEAEVLADRVQAMRERWQLRRAEAIAQEADRREAQGDLDGAVLLAERLLVSQPLSEHVHRRCMRLHYLRNDRAQALAAYARCRESLLRGLAVPPDAQTQQLARLIEASVLPAATMSHPAGLAAQAGAWGPADSVALTRPPRLVGRQRAWAAIEQAWQRGAPVVLRGEAGIGKTRLATDFAQARGFALVIKASVAEKAAPFALLARLLRLLRAHVPEPSAWAASELCRLVPEWGPPPAQPVEPLRLRQACDEVLASWTSAHTSSLVLDDVQWADVASLEALLGWFNRAGPRAPALLLCVRDDDMPPELSAWLGSRSASDGFDLKLGPLDEAGVAELLASLSLASMPVGSMPAAAAALMRQTGGHPFALLELLRAVPDAWLRPAARATDGPAYEQVLSMLERRLAKLAPASLRLARIAALSAPSFSVGLASDVSGQPEIDLVDAWRGLVDAQLLQADGQLFDLVRDAALLGIPVAVGKALHEQIAQSLQARAGRADRVASHWKAAGRWAEAAAAFELAAQAAHDTARAVEALTFWDEAAACHQQAGDSGRCWAARRSAVAAAMAAASARALAERIDQLMATAANASQALDAGLACCRALVDASSGAPAVEQAQAAMALAVRLNDAAREVAAAGWCGLALALDGQSAEGLALLLRFNARAQALADPRIRLDFHGSLGYTLVLTGDYAAALDALHTAADLAESLGSLGDAVEQVSNLSTCLNFLGRQTEAVQQGERALGLWRRMGEPPGVSGGAIQTQLAAHRMGVGRFRDAIELLEGALTCFRKAGPASWQTIAEHRLAEVYIRLGQVARARQVLTPLTPCADAGRRATRVKLESELAHLAGKPALPQLSLAAEQWATDLTPTDRRALRLQMAAHQSASDSLATSLDVLADAQAHDDKPSTVHALARAAYAHGQLGDGPSAAALVRRAWEMAAEVPPLDLSYPSLCWLVHRAARMGGDESTAAASLQGGAQWLADALPQVPEPFVRSFCELNPDHRQILAAVESHRGAYTGGMRSIWPG